MGTYLTIGLLLALSAAARAVADSIAHHNSLAHLGQWCDQVTSWELKYKEPVTMAGLANKELIPRFFGSTTFLVALTDAWHCACLVRDTCWQLAVALLLPLPWQWLLAAFLIGKAIYSGIFQLLYTYLNKQAT